MKMVMAVVPRDQVEDVLQALVAAGHTATFTESRGGMLRQAQMTLFIAVKAADLSQVLDILRDACRSVVTVEYDQAPSPAGPASTTARVGGAVVFVWDLERMTTY